MYIKKGKRNVWLTADRFPAIKSFTYTPRTPIASASDKDTAITEVLGYVEANAKKIAEHSGLESFKILNKS